MRTLKRFLLDVDGSASSIHLILVYAILVFGAVVGLTTLRDQVVQEYGDTSVALESLDQSYRVEACGSCEGYEYEDENPLEDNPDEPPGCIEFNPPMGEGT